MAELNHPTDVTEEPMAEAATDDDAQVDELADLDDIDMDFDLDEVENRIAPLALADRAVPGGRR